MANSRKNLPVVIDKRVPWGGASGEADILILGLNWSAGTFFMEFRNEAGDTGPALISLSNASAGAQGISASYEAGYLHPQTGETVGATIIRPQINETTLEGLDYGADPSQPLTLQYDVHATIAGMGKFILMAGTAVIVPGVTL